MIHLLAIKITPLVVWNFIWPIVVAVLLFSLIVFIHEFGHFIFAKIFGVKVNEFALGFGPTLLKFQKGETKYALRLFPLGGFCAMEGEDTTSTDQRSINNKPVWQRFIIIAAGAIFNLILGFILLMILTTQTGVPTPTIHSFEKNASSQASGLKEGDKIKSINGRAIFTADDVLYMLMNNSTDAGTVDMTVIRDQKKVQLDNVKFSLEEEQGKRFIHRDFIFVGIDKNIPNVVSYSFMRTISMARLVWMSLGDIITGKYGLNDLSGPIGTAQVVSQAVSNVPTIGIGGVLFIMSLITINLGVFNLLPIPALDGGRLVFLGIEGIRRKPIDPQKEGLVHAVGFAILILLIIIITGSDIWKLITGGPK